VDYNSFLTKDFKNRKPGRPYARRLRIHRRHVIALLSIVLISGAVLSVISLNARAKHHIQNLNDNPLSRVVLPIQLPASASNAAQTEKPAVPVKANLSRKIVESNDTHTIAVKVKHGDSLASIFQRNDLDPAELHNIIHTNADTKSLRHLVPGQSFRIQVDDDNAVQSLLYTINPLESLDIQRDGDDFIAHYHHKNVEKRINHASAIITSSLFEAGQSAGLSNQMIMELAHIFGWDIDFALNIRRGDSFSVVYEEDYLNGKKLNNGPILAAEFVNQGHVYKAIRYTDPTGNSDYYDPRGKSMRKAFLRTPVAFTRISSRFGLRYHPILHRKRMHTGVDYAAPRGTPIKATSDGKIVFIGRKGGYGNAILIKHNGIYSTLYGHMERFHRGMHRGKRVKQGQIIGYVGSTGLATGPHLHYEFRVHGVFRNPLTVKLPDAKPIKAAYRQDFEKHAQVLLSQLSVLSSTLALNR
jgi:murein DD-endopeptidase MepM/ murein hydrolase activator NlpD